MKRQLTTSAGIPVGDNQNALTAGPRGSPRPASRGALQRDPVSDRTLDSVAGRGSLSLRRGAALPDPGS